MIFDPSGWHGAGAMRPAVAGRVGSKDERRRRFAASTRLTGTRARGPVSGEFE